MFNIRSFDSANKVTKSVKLIIIIYKYIYLYMCRSGTHGSNKIGFYKCDTGWLIAILVTSELLKIFHPDVVLPLDAQSRISLKSEYNFI